MPKAPAQIERDPLRWTHALFVLFGAAQLCAAVVMFFAFNWRALPDLAKIAIPQAGMAAAFLVFALAPRASALGQAAGAVAIVLVGVCMAVVGQIFQLGADPWGLFALWAAFALPLALLARSDAYFALWFVIASIAYTLWAEQVAAARYGLEDRAIPAIFALLAAGVLLLRDLAARSAAGPQPRWQRWLFAIAALYAAGFAGLEEAVAADIGFASSYGTAVLLAVSAPLYATYRWIRPDRPTRSLALFAVALWLAVFGVRQLWRASALTSGDPTGLLLLSALWVIGVTAGLATLLRREGGRS